MRFFNAAFGLIRDAGIAWGQDKASLFAAAVAYYMAFSLAPLLVLSVSIAGQIFGQAAVEGTVVARIENMIGQEAAILLQSFLSGAHISASSFTLISTAILLYAASGVFNHLKRALDFIYGVIPRQMPGIRGAIYIIRTRAVTFALVIFMGILLLVALGLNAVAATIGDFVAGYIPESAIILTLINRVIAPILMFLTFALLFKTLPDALISWRDVWLGAAVTTFLFLVGTYVISIYLSVANVGSVYGAASSFIVVLVWIYYSAQIVMYGAEFTKVYANRYGRRILPNRDATFLVEYYNHQAENLPEPEAEVAPQREIFGQPAPAENRDDAPTYQGRKQLGAVLLGLAAGLFLAFLNQMRNND